MNATTTLMIVFPASHNDKRTWSLIETTLRPHNGHKAGAIVDHGWCATVPFAVSTDGFRVAMAELRKLGFIVYTTVIA